ECTGVDDGRGRYREFELRAVAALGVSISRKRHESDLLFVGRGRERPESGRLCVGFLVVFGADPELLADGEIGVIERTVAATGGRLAAGLRAAERRDGL